jgi:nitronate monooxygenase
MDFTNRGQGWVARKPESLLPRIEDPSLHEILQSMPDAHVVNIASANDALQRRGHVTPQRS